MVPSWADQLLPQLLMEQFDTLPIQYRHIEHMHEGVWYRKNNFWQNDNYESLDNVSLILLLNMRRWCLHWPINSYHKFLMEQFDTLPIQYRHIEHMHEGVWFRKNNFWQNDSCENLDNFSLKLLLYMRRWCLHGLINSYHSFWWSNLILCLFNIDTLNICMKVFGSEKIIFDKMTTMRA